MKTDRQKFLEVSRFVAESVTGETLPLVTRVQAVAAEVPLILDLVGALGEALERVHDLSQEELEHDPRLLRDFFKRSEHAARIEGAIAVLLVVGEELREPPIKKVRSPRKKK